MTDKTLYNYKTPNGTMLQGTFDIVSARANILGFDANGEPEFEGYTEVFWDDQRTQQENGKDLYLDECGDTWTLDQCTRVEQE